MLKTGSIEFGGGAFDCSVRNMSDSGAALAVFTPLFVPDRFTLVVPADGLKRLCMSSGERKSGSALRLDSAHGAGFVTASNFWHVQISPLHSRCR